MNKMDVTLMALPMDVVWTRMEKRVGNHLRSWARHDIDARLSWRVWIRIREVVFTAVRDRLKQQEKET